MHRTRLLALRPPRPPQAELAPQPLGEHGGRPYERRLTVLLERAWPVIREALVGVAVELGLPSATPEEPILCARAGCGHWRKDHGNKGHDGASDECDYVEDGPDGAEREGKACECTAFIWPLSALTEDRLASVIAAHIFDRGSAERAVDDTKHEEAERHWLAVEHKLVAIMTERGLDLDLACANIGLSLDKVRARCDVDPFLAARLEDAWKRGTAKLHGAVWDAAMRGKERSAIALLQARDPRFQSTVRVEIGEREIIASPAFQAVVARVVKVLAEVVVVAGGEDYQRGWAEGRASLRERVQEELGGG